MDMAGLPPAPDAGMSPALDLGMPPSPGADFGMSDGMGIPPMDMAGMPVNDLMSPPIPGTVGAGNPLRLDLPKMPTDVRLMKEPVQDLPTLNSGVKRPQV